MVNSRQSKVRSEIEEIIRRQGCELVEFNIFQHQGKFTIRALIDYPQGGITLGDCARINREVFSFLEESDILGGDFTVEVNSPGLKRSLKNHKDFMRIKGKTACLWLNDAVDGKSYWEGEVIDADQDTLIIKIKDKELSISINNVNCGKEKVDL
jgi:ribosome maturation factor RimP